MYKPLQGLNILDVTSRLPGPLASSLLQDFGASVIKLENKDYPDPFKQATSNNDSSFPLWYKSLNQHKEVRYLNFKAHEQLEAILSQADIVLLGLPHTQSKLISEISTNIPKVKSVITLIGSHQQNQPMHDINALARTGLLKLYLKNQAQTNKTLPPFLPLAGIGFAQSLATFCLATYIQAIKKQEQVQTSFSLLEDGLKALEKVGAPLLNQKTYQYLHNGLYPCYGLYKTQDGHYLALALIEEKYWNQFAKEISLPISAQERFSTDPKINKKMQDFFLSSSLADWKTLLQNKVFCVDFINLSD